MGERMVTCLLLVGLVATGCDRETEAAPVEAKDAAQELRIYEVPDGLAHEAVSVLRTLIRFARTDEAPLGWVTRGPGGEVLVTAPPTFHAGVADFVERLRTASPAPTPTVALEYWLLLGRPAAAPTDAAAFDPAVRPAVAAIQKSHGPLRLVPAGRVKLASLSGEEAQSEGGSLVIRQSASLHRGQILAEVRLSPGPDAHLETRVQIPPDRLVVLGYAGIEGAAVRDAFPEVEPQDARATAFYVVRGSLTAFGE